MKEEQAETRAAIIKLSLTTLQSIIGDGCRVVRAGITDDDFASNSISLIVTGHPDLPLAKEGHKLQRMICLMRQNEDGTQSIESFVPC